METFTIALIILIVLICCFFIYKLLAAPYSLFKELGIPGPKPNIFMGNLGDFMNKGVLQAQLQYTKEYGPLSGFYLGRTPQLMVADPELIKQVCVKDFHDFPNRRSNSSSLFNKTFKSFLTVLTNEHWKHVRSVITPAFSTGKLKAMIPSINHCARQFAEKMADYAESGKSFEAREVFGCYSMDVIARTAFGIELDAQKTPNHPFITNLKDLAPETIPKSRWILFAMPFLADILNFIGIKIEIFPKKAEDFFIAITNETIAQRKAADEAAKANQYRSDFLQLMMNSYIDDETLQKEYEAKSEFVHRSPKNDMLWHEKGITHNELMAQALLFFFAGHETTASTLSFFAYCMQKNPEEQDKCIAEIDDVFPNGADPNYEDVHKLTYLDQCINEALRLYPIASLTDRTCNADFELAGQKFPKDVHLMLAIYWIHHNPEYWPDPEKFDPDRFLGQSASEMENKYIYLPFGVGPRNCIGKRLALMEMKILLVKFYQQFKFKANVDAPPIEFGKMGLLRSKDGVHLRVEARN